MIIIRKRNKATVDNNSVEKEDLKKNFKYNAYIFCLDFAV